MTRIHAVSPSGKPLTTLRLAPGAAAMRLALLAFAASAPMASHAVPLANALPTGFALQFGNVDAPTTQAHVMTILQHSGFALIDWDTFNIGSNASVVFDQPGAGSVVLNRVTGVGRSEIFGSLSGDGTVGVINSAGVLFGAGSSINVSGLIASSLNLVSSNNDGVAVTFDLDFTGASGDGAVINRGTIDAGAGGVTFIGRQVLNQGAVTVTGGGSAQLIGAEGASVTMPKDGAKARDVDVTAPTAISALSSGGEAGVINAGTITAHDIALSATIAPGLLDKVVNNTGLLVASGVDVQNLRNGGTVNLVAEGAGINTGNVTSLGFANNTDGTVGVTTDGDVKVGAINAGDTGNVLIDVDGAVLDGNAAAVNVTAGDLTVQAGGKVVLGTNVARLDAQSDNGGITIDEANGLQSAHIQTVGRGIALNAGGTIASLDLDTSGGAGGGNVNVTTSAGDIVVDQVVGPDAVRLTATNGKILDDANDNALDIDADKTVLVARNGIGAADGNGSLDLFGVVDLSVTGAGNIDVHGVAFNALSAQTANGSIKVVSDGAMLVDDVVSHTDADANDIILRSSDQVVLGNVDAGPNAGDVTIQAHGILESGDDGTDITGDRVVLRSDLGAAGTSGNGRIETRANELVFLDVNASGATLIDELDDVTIRFNGIGALDLHAGGSIAVGAIVTGGNATTLSAGGAITDANGGATNVTGTTLDLAAANGIDLDTDVDSVDANVTGTGNVSLDEANALLLRASTADGSIAVRAGDLLVAGKVTSLNDSDANDISLRSGGNLVLGKIDAGNAGDVSLTSTGGAILDNVEDHVVDVTGDRVSFHALNGIGSNQSQLGSIDTSANQITATLDSPGRIDLAETDDVQLAGIDGGGIDPGTVASIVTITAGGNIEADGLTNAGDFFLRAGGDLVVGTVETASVGVNQQGIVLLDAGGAIVDGNGAGTNVATRTLYLRGVNDIDLDTTVESVNARSTSGSIVLSDSDDLLVDRVAATNDATIATGGDLTLGFVRGSNVTLGAGGAIVGLDAQLPNVRSGGLLMASAGNGLTLETDVATVEGHVTGTGDIDLRNRGALVATDVTAADGDITIVAADGALTAERVVAADHAILLRSKTADLDVGTIRGADVTLSGAGAITDANGGATNVSAGTLTATSANGIDLDTNVATLSANVTGTGAIAIDESNSVTLADVRTANGAIRIDAGRTVALGGVSASGGTGDVHIGSGSAIVDDVNDDLVDVAGGAVELTAAKGIGDNAGGSIDTQVGSLALATTQRDITIAQTGALTLTGGTAANGNIDVSATRRLTADGVSASGDVSLASGADSNLEAGVISGQTVHLTAGRAIVDTNGAATNVSGGALVARASRDIDLDTGVDSIRATSTDRGSITLFDGGDVSVDGVSTRRGAVTIIALGDLIARRVSSGGGAGNDITLTSAAGDIVVGNVDAGNANVALTASSAFGQQVLDDGRAGTQVHAQALDIAAATGIGTADSALGTDVGTLRAEVVNGVIVIREVDGLNLERAVTPNGEVSVRAGGNVVVGDVSASTGDVIPGTGDVTLVSTGGALTDDGVDTTRVTGTSLTARAASDISLDTRVRSVNATAVDGDVRIDDRGGNLEVGKIRGDAVTLGASSALLGVGDAPNVRATSLDATSGGRMNLSTEVDTIAAHVTNAGSIRLSEATSVELTDVSAASGNVSVTAGGNLVTGTVSGNTMRLVAGGAISDANGAGTVNATGGTLVADAGRGIDLDTEVDTIRQATSATGNVTIREATSAAIGTVRGVTASLTAGGAFTDANGDAINVTADTLVARVADGIDLDTRIDTLDAAVTGDGNLDIADFNGLTILGARTDGGDLHLTTGNDGNLLILDAGSIDAGDGDVTLDVGGAVRQESRRENASIDGGSLTINAGGNVGQLLAPLFVNIDGPVTIAFGSDRPVALITGFFGSLNEGRQVFGLAANTELSSNVGAIQASFQKTVTFNLDSSQFAVQTRIYATEGTGILLPEEVRE